MVFQHHVHQPADVSFCLKYNTPVELRHAHKYAAVKQSCSRDEVASFSRVLWLSQAVLTDKDPRGENITLIVLHCYACVATYVCTYVRTYVCTTVRLSPKHKPTVYHIIACFLLPWLPTDPYRPLLSER